MAGVDSVAEEFQGLKKTYRDQCKVTSGMGEVAHMVTIKPKNTDLVLRFQLTDEYPKVIPQVIIKSAKIEPDDLVTLTSELTAKADDLSGEPMIHPMVEFIIRWLYERAIDVAVEPNPTKGKTSPKSNKKAKKIKEDYMGPEKKPPMKTATDVINRILWDDDLQQDCFIIGYLDRIIGLVEKVFTAFSWEDIASVDYNTLAIPKHRIQYFKYKKLKVWDKNKRLDNVYGSTGSGLTITEVMRRYDEENQVDDEGMMSDDDDSDDDGININVGEQIVPHGDNWQDKLRPNHFLALRITDEEIQKNISNVQDAILEAEERYVDCLIPQGALHITLCTLGLDTPEQVQRAVEFLQIHHVEIRDMLPKDLSITFKGVGTFFDRVLYAKPIDNPAMSKYVDYIRALCQENGVEIRDNHEFVPHLTVMKVTRPTSRAMGSKVIDPQLYSGMHDIDWGCQLFDEMHLCSMDAERRYDGFYMSPTAITLQ